MKSNLPDPRDDYPDVREVDCDLMHDAIMCALPRRLKRRRDRGGIPLDVRVDPDDCSASLRRTRRSRKVFVIRVDAAMDSDCGDEGCLGCRTEVLAHVLTRVLEEGCK